MAAKRKTIVDNLMAEVISYGGIAATRIQAYEHALACCMSRLEGEPDQERRARLGADQFAFGSRAKALSADEAACLIPWDYAVAHNLL